MLRSSQGDNATGSDHVSKPASTEADATIRVPRPSMRVVLGQPRPRRQYGTLGEAMGSPGLFVLKEDGSLIGLEEAAYEAESMLQALLARYPELMPGDQIDSETPRRWLLITRELGVPDDVDAANRWSLDHLFVDQDGVPTLVEVKRQADTRIRREVVGQMLDYAANAVVHWPIEAIRAAFERRCERDGKDAAHELQGFLGPEGQAEAFWSNVKTNLHAGKIRLLFVSDVIPAELRRIVEFLNEQMDPAEVLAIEVRQFTGQGLKTLVPKVFGQTAQADRKKATGGRREARRWDEPSFFEKLAQRRNDEESRVARTLFDWAQRGVSHIEYGTGPTMASFHAVHYVDEGAWFRPFGVYASETGASVEVPLGGSTMRLPPFDRDAVKLDLVRRVNSIEGIKIAEDLSRRPGIPLAVLAKGDRLMQFLRVMDWAVQQVKEAPAPTTQQ